MTTYRPADDDAKAVIEKMLAKYHGPLHDVSMSVDCLFAYSAKDKNGDSKGPALTLGGYACNAIVRIVSLKDRAKGLADAEIVLDGEQWPTWCDEQREALIDHELEHLDLVTDAEGCAVRDDLERPKLRMRKHDLQVGWFYAVARRHGEYSFEVQQYRDFHEETGQQWLPGFSLGDDDAKVTLRAGGREVDLSVKTFAALAGKKIRRNKAASGKA